MWRLLCLIVLGIWRVNGDFNPDTTDFDAYGVKIAANDFLLIEAQGSSTQFLVQYSPYDYGNISLQCSVSYDDSTHYVYTVGVGIKQNTTSSSYFYFAGEIVPQSATDQNVTFVGIWINQDWRNAQYYIANQQSISCDNFSLADLTIITGYGHQEFFVIAVEPYGQYVLGMAQDFIFSYQPFNTTSLTMKQSTPIWPNNITFSPLAADASQTFTVVAGLAQYSSASQVHKIPTIHVLRNSNLNVLTSWSYTSRSGSWQSRLSYMNSDSWNKQYTMSVKINPFDATRVLVGMPFLNTVFLFVIQNNGYNITLVSTADNGEYVGFGKSVVWLTSSQAAFLVSTYSLDYSNFISSSIYVYTSLNSTTIPSSPTVKIPNIEQSIPSSINSLLIQTISTPESLAILDTDGDILLLLAAPPGYYASSNDAIWLTDSAIPIVSSTVICLSGMYKSDSGIHPCFPCPSGTLNLGGFPCISCNACLPTTFCPMGAVYGVDSKILDSSSQAYAYPRSPELTQYEDILLSNMFYIGSTAHCIVVSPVFWASIIGVIALLTMIGIHLLHWFFRSAKSAQMTNVLKEVFRRTDLIVGYLYFSVIYEYYLLIFVG